MAFTPSTLQSRFPKFLSTLLAALALEVVLILAVFLMLYAAPQKNTPKQSVVINLSLNDKTPDEKPLEPTEPKVSVPIQEPLKENSPAEIPVAAVQPPEPETESLALPVPPEPVAEPPLPVVDTPAPKPVAPSKPVQAPKKKAMTPVAPQKQNISESAQTTERQAQPVAQSNQTSAVDPMDAYRSRVNQAIQAAVVCSLAAQNMKMSGKVRVNFDLKDTIASATIVTAGSGKPMLDSAAVSAVQQARFPVPPADFTGQTKLISVLIVLQCSN